jgi:hypothetical protein
VELVGQSQPASFYKKPSLPENPSGPDELGNFTPKKPAETIHTKAHKTPGGICIPIFLMIDLTGRERLAIGTE